MVKRSHIIEGTVLDICWYHNKWTQTKKKKSTILANCMIIIYLSHIRNALLASDILHWSLATPSLVSSLCQSRMFRNKGAESEWSCDKSCDRSCDRSGVYYRCFESLSCVW